MSDTLFLGALGTLAGVIGVLWRVNLTNTQKIERRADKIEERHQAATEKLVNLSREVGELKGRVHLAEQVLPKLEDLHHDLLASRRSDQGNG